jgi:hypothetical protein
MLSNVGMKKDEFLSVPIPFNFHEDKQITHSHVPFSLPSPPFSLSILTSPFHDHTKFLLPDRYFGERGELLENSAFWRRTVPPSTERAPMGEWEMVSNSRIPTQTQRETTDPFHSHKSSSSFLFSILSLLSSFSSSPTSLPFTESLSTERRSQEEKEKRDPSVEGEEE